jgi:predicted ATPase
MSDTIKRISIEGFKSIRRLDNLELRGLNVLIGANGAGKSNFVEFFRLLRAMFDQDLQKFINVGGRADAFLYLGPKTTTRIVGDVQFGNNGYKFSLVPTADNRLIFESEVALFSGNTQYSESLGRGHDEAKLPDRKDDPGNWGAQHGVAFYVYEAVSRWIVYHFHDTSPESGVRRQGAINDNEYLRPRAENLAAFLFRLQQTNPACYARIRDAVRLAAPFFDDFKLRPVPDNPELIQLEWLQRDSDYPFRPGQLSDGTLRFICLATALMQPSPPATMLFDEPELGSHPYALTLLGNLFRQAVQQFGSYTSKQVIVSTQSVQLVNEFAPEDVVVVERAQGESIFRRLEPASLSGWLEDYSLGELWQKNVFGAGPRNETIPLPPASVEDSPSAPGGTQNAGDQRS